MVTSVKIILTTIDSHMIEIGKVSVGGLVGGLKYKDEMEEEGCLIAESVEDDPHLSAFMISKTLVDYETWYYLYEVFRGIDMQNSSEYYLVKIPTLYDNNGFFNSVEVGEYLHVDAFNRPKAFEKFFEICASY